MRKLLFVFIAISFLFVSGCGVNKIKTNSLDKIIIVCQEPISGESDSYSGKVLRIFTSKEEIKRIVNAIENATKETDNLQYEEKKELHYIIKLYYKGIPKTAYNMFLEEDWERAVFTNLNYYYISQDDTKWLKSFIYK